MPTITAMKNLHLSVHSFEYVYLRNSLIQRRKELGLSQRALAERLGVVYSFVSKVETGDRRLDIFELLEYCQALEMDIVVWIKALQQKLQDKP